jgi:hypothetical protein
MAERAEEYIFLPLEEKPKEINVLIQKIISITTI